MLIIQVLEGKQCRPSVDRDKTARDEPPQLAHYCLRIQLCL